MIHCGLKYERSGSFHRQLSCQRWKRTMMTLRLCHQLSSRHFQKFCNLIGKTCNRLMVLSASYFHLDPIGVARREWEGWRSPVAASGWESFSLGRYGDGLELLTRVMCVSPRLWWFPPLHINRPTVMSAGGGWVPSIGCVGNRFSQVSPTRQFLFLYPSPQLGRAAKAAGSALNQGVQNVAENLEGALVTFGEGQAERAGYELLLMLSLLSCCLDWH